MEHSQSEGALSLQCGDVSPDHPASFSRFVLPFGYQLTPTARPEKQSPYYSPLTIEDMDADCARRHYLTRETATVLFERTAWFQLHDSDLLGGTGSEKEGPVAHATSGDPRTFRVYRSEEEDDYFTARIVSVRLAMFEYVDPSPSKMRPPTATRSHGDPLQTGFLTLDVAFPTDEYPPTLDDLLTFNELFRFWRRPWKTHFNKKGEGGYCTVMRDTPIYIGGVRRPLHETYAEDSGVDPYFDRWASLLEFPLMTGTGEAFRLFPESWSRGGHVWMGDPLAESAPGWIVYADDRTFVWSCAVIKNGTHAVVSAEAASSPEESARWVKFLNVDPAPERNTPLYPTTEFERAWARNRTYTRWEHVGTLYGFTYHSGVMLGAPCAEPATHVHFRDVYFDLLALLFYLRVSSFRLSERLATNSARLRALRTSKRYNMASIEREFGELREQFALFSNLYEYPLLSNQQQAVEMYAHMRNALDVREFFTELSEEIRNTHEHFELAAARRLARTSTILTSVAAAGAPLAILTAFLGLPGLTSLNRWQPIMQRLAPGWTLTQDALDLAHFCLAMGLFVMFLLAGVVAGLLLWKDRRLSRTSVLSHRTGST